MSDSSEISCEAVRQAIERGVEPPNVLAEAIETNSYQSTNEIDWIASLHAPCMPPGSRGMIQFIIQNATAGSCEAEMRMDMQEHPNFFSSKIDLKSIVTVQLAPLQVVLIKIPFWVMTNAGQGRYTFRLNVTSKPTAKRGLTRLRKKNVQPPVATNWGKVIAKNAVGLGLAATLGLGFYSIPRSFSGVCLDVNRSASAPPQMPEREETISLWSVEVWSQSLQATVSAQQGWSSFRQLLKFQLFWPRAMEYAEQAFPSLDQGQCLSIAFSIAGNLEMMLNDFSDRADGIAIQWYRDAILNCSSSQTSAVIARFVAVASQAMIRITAAAAYNRHCLATKRSDAGEMDFVQDYVERLTVGTLSPSEFWLIWGRDGLDCCRSIAPEVLTQMREPIAQSVALRSHALGANAVTVLSAYLSGS